MDDDRGGDRAGCGFRITSADSARPAGRCRVAPRKDRGLPGPQRSVLVPMASDTPYSRQPPRIRVTAPRRELSLARKGPAMDRSEPPWMAAIPATRGAISALLNRRFRDEAGAGYRR